MPPGPRVGISAQKADVTECMVIGCVRRALYRNAQSSRAGKRLRGYCRQHKDLALERHSEQTMAKNEDWIIKREL